MFIKGTEGRTAASLQDVPSRFDPPPHRIHTPFAYLPFVSPVFPFFSHIVFKKIFSELVGMRSDSRVRVCVRVSVQAAQVYARVYVCVRRCVHSRSLVLVFLMSL